MTNGNREIAANAICLHEAALSPRVRRIQEPIAR